MSEPQQKEIKTRNRRKSKIEVSASSGASEDSAKRIYIRQSDVPVTSLDEALRIPEIIFDNYAGKPTTPFNVAKALGVDPKGSQLRLLSGAAIAFGLIEGGAQAANISVTDLSKRIIRPKIEGDALLAKREAVLKPRIFNEFLTHYSGNVFPKAEIAKNVIEEMGVGRAKVSEVFDRIKSSAASVGFLVDIKGKSYVQLDSDHESQAGTEEQIVINDEYFRQDDVSISKEPENIPQVPSKTPALTAAYASDQRRKRVFVTHGKDRDLVDPIKKLLEYGELEAVVSVERQSVSKPVPEKVMDDMRRCGAAIIHVKADKTIKDESGEEHTIINSNVLIEIGAAMAFYGRRFILLVQDGLRLPSNLQGLYEVRYSGQSMDASATIKLLEAMKDIKNYPLPIDKELD